MPTLGFTHYQPVRSTLVSISRQANTPSRLNSLLSVSTPSPPWLRCPSTRC
jgi:hypothetical protein